MNSQKNLTIHKCSNNLDNLAIHKSSNNLDIATIPMTNENQSTTSKVNYCLDIEKP